MFSLFAVFYLFVCVMTCRKNFHYDNLMKVFLRDCLHLCQLLNHLAPPVQPVQLAQAVHSLQVAKPVKPIEGSSFKKS